MCSRCPAPPRLLLCVHAVPSCQDCCVFTLSRPAKTVVVCSRCPVPPRLLLCVHAVPSCPDCYCVFTLSRPAKTVVVCSRCPVLPRLLLCVHAVPSCPDCCCVFTLSRPAKTAVVVCLLTAVRGLRNSGTQSGGLQDEWRDGGVHKSDHACPLPFARSLR